MLFLTLFEATLIDRCHFGKSVQFEVTWGHVDAKTKEKTLNNGDGDSRGGDDDSEDEGGDSSDDSSSSLLQGFYSRSRG